MDLEQALDSNDWSPINLMIEPQVMVVPHDSCGFAINSVNFSEVLPLLIIMETGKERCFESVMGACTPGCEISRDALTLA